MQCSLLNSSTVRIQLCVTVVYVQIVCPLKNSPNIAIHSQRTSNITPIQKSWIGQIVIIVCSMWHSSVCGVVHMTTSKWYHCLVVFSLQALQSKKRPDKQLLRLCITRDCSCVCGDGSYKLISALLLLSAIALFSFGMALMERRRVTHDRLLVLCDPCDHMLPCVKMY